MQGFPGGDESDILLKEIFLAGGTSLKSQGFDHSNNDLVAKVLDSQSRGPVFKTTGWLQGRLSLSSLRGR